MSRLRLGAGDHRNCGNSCKYARRGRCLCNEREARSLARLSRDGLRKHFQQHQVTALNVERSVGVCSSAGAAGRSHPSSTDLPARASRFAEMPHDFLHGPRFQTSPDPFLAVASKSCPILEHPAHVGVNNRLAANFSPFPPVCRFLLQSPHLNGPITDTCAVPGSYERACLGAPVFLIFTTPCPTLQ
jgi:hypothetical protein